MKIFFNDEQIIRYLKKKGYIVEKKENRIKYITKAREERQKAIKEKIQKAIQEMREKNIPINANQLSKHAKVNYRTALKYLKKVKNENIDRQN